MSGPRCIGGECPFTVRGSSHRAFRTYSVRCGPYARVVANVAVIIAGCRALWSARAAVKSLSGIETFIVGVCPRCRARSALAQCSTVLPTAGPIELPSECRFVVVGNPASVGELGDALDAASEPWIAVITPDEIDEPHARHVICDGEDAEHVTDALIAAAARLPSEALRMLWQVPAGARSTGTSVLLGREDEPEAAMTALPFLIARAMPGIRVRPERASGALVVARYEGPADRARAEAVEPSGPRVVTRVSSMDPDVPLHHIRVVVIFVGGAIVG